MKYTWVKQSDYSNIFYFNQTKTFYKSFKNLR